MERIKVSEAFKKKAGEKVKLAVWVNDTRALGKVRFLVLRDLIGKMQCVVFMGETPEAEFEKIGKLNREIVVYIEGIIKDSKQAPGGKEIGLEKIELVNSAEEKLPIDVSDFSKTEMPKRLDYKFLDFHRERVQAIFKIQTEIANSFRKYFYEKGYIEIQQPYMISAASEGGIELFEVKYFEKKAFMAQSPQLYKQMLACSIEKTFTLGPAWRAEKHNTTRHINEIRMPDVEAAFTNQMQIMQEQEGCIKFIVTKILENCKKELEILGVKLKVPKGIYLTYEEGIKKLGEKLEKILLQNKKKIM